MAYKTLIFDFDGTLADTQQSIIQTMRFVGEHLNIKNIDEALIKSLIGLPLKSTFEKAFSLDEKAIQEATIIYRKHYNEIAIDAISLFEGVKETLAFFHGKGINLAVASSKGREALIKILQKQNVYELFTFIGGEEDAKNKKPAPDIVNLIMDKFNYNPEECLVIGDTVFDIEMGQRAFVDTCGITYGNNTEDELKKQKPNYIINSFNELKDIV
ncbi:HAD family hydrolase [Chondrinema litorale]|uniref:HAD family hydrolase n=1 Tax=Chondrinema litorale TaxID=2994555 RepID=UPI0025436CFA|nr:HAD family hydrolase [Chondrinema litorale]UZR99729.1 HAD family hydrolase [Chondrinema litorale]